ncbi:MAG: hypothetical protein MZV63_55255 [Marinilabiliales bacterium]|nr:hypothetical protein [Marinilabiliales bacterium]
MNRSYEGNMAAYREEYGDDIDPSYHPLIRSREACYSSSSSAVARAKRCGTKLHLLHLSTAEETGLLTPGHDPSVKHIIGEVCVHHLWFDDSFYAEKGNLINGTLRSGRPLTARPSSGQ